MLVIARLRIVNQQLDYLRYAQEDIQAQSDLKASDYQSTMAYSQLRFRLDNALEDYTHRSLSTKQRPVA